MSSPRKRGRSAEYKIAKLLKGERTRILGVSAPDVLTKWGAYEVKLTKRFPARWWEVVKKLELLTPERSGHYLVLIEPDTGRALVIETLAQHREHHGEVVREIDEPPEPSKL